jgi:calcium-dependent protein kinase
MSSVIRKKILRGVLNALAEMDSKLIVHRDIKPENIMVDGNGEARLIDFGLATETNSPNYLYVRCGTPGFVAPEIIGIRDTGSAKMSTISDVFSVGAIFYQMIFGTPLFGGDRNAEVLEKNRRCVIHIPTEEETDTLELALLRRMLDVCSSTRITAAQALLSPYFSEGREPLQEISLSQKCPASQHAQMGKYSNSHSVRFRKAKHCNN